MTQIGQYIGPYRLIGQIGSGKTCQVWESMLDSRNLRLAIKVIAPTMRRTAEPLNLLRHEFMVGRQLDHPQVIKHFEFDTTYETPILAMEYFGPANLRQLIAAGSERLVPQMMKVIEQSAQGLAYIHRQGWIHRDVKPNNFLIDDAGTVKLIDFALAQRKQGALARLFSRSKVQGTRSYMSPEQIRGQAIDRRADIYSFGCMLQELVTGKPPFKGADTNELLTRHLRMAPPSVASLNPDVTPEFAKLVQRILEKDPGRRPQSMEDVLWELRSVSVFKRSYRTAPD